MPEPEPQRETPEAGLPLEQMGSGEPPSREAAVQKYRELHAETEKLSQEEASDRDATLRDLQREIYGAGSASTRESLTKQMKKKGAVILSSDEARSVGDLQAKLRAAEAIKKFHETPDEELGRDVEKAFASAEKLELDLSDIPDKSGRKALERISDRDIDSAVGALEERPPEEKAA